MALTRAGWQILALPRGSVGPGWIWSTLQGEGRWEHGGREAFQKIATLSWPSNRWDALRACLAIYGRNEAVQKSGIDSCLLSAW